MAGEHTPGPWYVVKHKTSFGDECWDVFAKVAEVDGQVNADIFLGVSGTQIEANVKLIAKAWLIPELVEACETALATLEHHQADLTYLGRLPVTGVLREAIARAKG